MLALLAQAAEDFDSSVDITTTGDTAAATGLIAGMGIFFVVFMIIALVLGVFTIWMFIDSLIRKDDDFATGSKALWAILIFFFGFLPAILYFFMVKKKSGQGGGTSAPTQQTPADTAAK